MFRSSRTSVISEHSRACAPERNRDVEETLLRRSRDDRIFGAVRQIMTKLSDVTMITALDSSELFTGSALADVEQCRRVRTFGPTSERRSMLVPADASTSRGP